MMNNASFKLALMYLMHNIKRYIIIILLLSLSLSILLFSCYFSLSYNRNYKNELNNNKSYLTLRMTNDNDEYSDEINKILSQDNDVSNYINYKKYNIKYLITYEKTYPFARTFHYPILKIDESLYSYNVSNGSYNDEFHLFEDSNTIFDESEYEYANKYNEKLIITGSIDDLCENEIIISSNVCDVLNIDYNEIIGKSLSYSIFYTDNDELNKKTVLNNYTVKAVFNSKFYSTLSSAEQGYEQTSVFAFLNIKNKADLEEVTSSYNVCQIYFKNYSHALNGYIKYQDFYNENYLSHDKHISITYSNVLQRLLDSIDYIKFLSKILNIISILIFIVMILNLFNISLYMAKKRYSFLNMCKKIGLNDIEKKRFILYENVTIFSIVIIISIIISAIVSFVLTNLFNNYLKHYDYAFNVISFKYYPLVILFFIIILTLFIYIFTKLIDFYINYKKFNSNF